MEELDVKIEVEVLEALIPPAFNRNIDYGLYTIGVHLGYLDKEGKDCKDKASAFDPRGHLNRRMGLSGGFRGELKRMHWPRNPRDALTYILERSLKERK